MLADEFCKFEQKADECNQEYIARFSNLETKLKNENVRMDSLFLQAVMLNKSNILQPEKNNILANFDIDKESPEEMLKKIKNKIKDLDATKKPTKNKSNDYVNETLYGNNGGNYYRR